MALAPKGSRSKFRESIRIPVPLALPRQESSYGYQNSGISGTDVAFFEALADEFAEENERQASLDKKREASDIVGWQRWAAREFRGTPFITINSSNTNPDVDEVRVGWERYFEDASNQGCIDDLVEPRIRRQGAKLSKLDYSPLKGSSRKPRGSTPPGLGTGQHDEYVFLGAGAVYKRLSNIILHPDVFVGRKGFMARLKQYLSTLERTSPRVLLDRRLVYNLARDILKTDSRMPSYDETTRSEFIRMTALIESRMHGIPLAYHSFPIEYLSETGKPSNGKIPNESGMLKTSQPFVYRPQETRQNGHHIQPGSFAPSVVNHGNGVYVPKQTFKRFMPVAYDPLFGAVSAPSRR